MARCGTEHTQVTGHRNKEPSGENHDVGLKSRKAGRIKQGDVERKKNKEHRPKTRLASTCASGECGRPCAPLGKADDTSSGATAMLMPSATACDTAATAPGFAGRVVGRCSRANRQRAKLARTDTTLIAQSTAKHVY